MPTNEGVYGGPEKSFEELSEIRIFLDIDNKTFKLPLDASF